LSDRIQNFGAEWGIALFQLRFLVSTLHVAEVLVAAQMASISPVETFERFSSAKLMLCSHLK
jgi:hypothetical protein